MRAISTLVLSAQLSILGCGQAPRKQPIPLEERCNPMEENALTVLENPHQFVEMCERYDPEYLGARECAEHFVQQVRHDIHLKALFEKYAQGPWSCELNTEYEFLRELSIPREARWIAYASLRALPRGDDDYFKRIFEAYKHERFTREETIPFRCAVEALCKIQDVYSVRKEINSIECPLFLAFITWKSDQPHNSYAQLARERLAVLSRGAPP